jgi:hypothetical protein
MSLSAWTLWLNRFYPIDAVSAAPSFGGGSDLTTRFQMHTPTWVGYPANIDRELFQTVVACNPDSRVFEGLIHHTARICQTVVSSLPSANSAGRGTLPLFAGFLGTMELCDSPVTSISALWVAPSPTDSLLWKKRMSPGSLGFREESFQPCLWSLSPWGSHRTRRASRST